jgi:2-phosphosulfolactate phosphatase
MATLFENPLLVGEVGGNKPNGFELNNSPTQIEHFGNLNRPVVMVSSSGTKLFDRLSNHKPSYVACFRNFKATIDYLVEHHDRVALIGAPTRGEFREEDQMCCAWIGAGLMREGFKPEDESTAEIVHRWKNVPVEAVAKGKSAEYLKSSNQTRDLKYILNHINDVFSVFAIKNAEILKTCHVART